MNEPRNLKTSGPWCWQSKAALRVVSDACEGRTDLAHVLAVYLALSWIASDTQAERFTASKAQIAQRAGVSYRKAADVLALLVRLGLVASAENLIPGTKEKGPNTYTLGTVCTTSRTECLRLGTTPKIDPCRDYRKNLFEESPEGAPRRGGVATKQRKPNPLFDALALHAEGSIAESLTKSAKRTVGTALAEIRAASPDVTAAEIQRRAENYRQHFTGAACTACALAKHWARCVTTPAAPRPAQPQPARAAVC